MPDWKYQAKERQRIDIYGAESMKAEAVTEKWSDLGW